MANISYVKVNNTTYGIEDALARQYLTWRGHCGSAANAATKIVDLGQNTPDTFVGGELIVVSFPNGNTVSQGLTISLRKDNTTIVSAPVGLYLGNTWVSGVPFNQQFVTFQYQAATGSSSAVFYVIGQAPSIAATPNRVIANDAYGRPNVTSVTTSELECLSGATSNLQTEITNVKSDLMETRDTTMIPYLADGTDFNDVRSIGKHNIAVTYTYTNCPIDNTKTRSVLFVEAPAYVAYSQIFQMLVDYGTGYIYTRWYVSQKWSEWKTLFDVVGAVQELKSTKRSLADRNLFGNGYVSSANDTYATSANWDAYVIPAESNKKLRFVSFGSSDIYAAAFYSSDIPSDATFISGIIFKSTSQTTPNDLIFEPVAGAKSILLFNRKATNPNCFLYEVEDSLTGINDRVADIDRKMENVERELSGEVAEPIFQCDANKYVEYPANESAVATVKWFSDYIPVAGGTWVHAFFDFEALYLPENYSGFDFRIYQYDSTDTRITYDYYNTDYYDDVALWLDKNTAKIRLCVVPKVPAHETKFADLIHCICTVYNSVNNYEADAVRGQKLACGTNPVTKAIDHGGFYRSSDGTRLYENSPAAFAWSAREGIIYHNVDIVFSSDGVPFAFHDQTTTDTDGVEIDLTALTAEEIKTHQVGDERYSWTILTLAEMHEYLKKLGGVIEMVDISNASDPTKSAADAASLPAYYRAHNIKPSFTNFDRENDRNAFITAGPEFGVYIVCNTPLTTSIPAAITYIQNHPGTDYALNIYWSDAPADTDMSPYLPTLSALGVKLYTYSFYEANLNKVKGWIDGFLSSSVNVNYELYRQNARNVFGN